MDVFDLDPTKRVLQTLVERVLQSRATRDSLEDSPPTESEVIDQVIHVLGTNASSAINMKYILDEMYGIDFGNKNQVVYGAILVEYGLTSMTKIDGEHIIN